MTRHSGVVGWHIWHIYDDSDVLQRTSALVMGDLLLPAAGLKEGRDLKRGGVLYWNSRTRSARGLKGLLPCKQYNRLVSVC